MSTEVTVITSLSCDACDRVKARLEKLRAETDALEVREIDIGSAEGTAIAIRYRLGGLPGVLINGRMALVGDVSESLLLERIQGASGVPPSGQ